MIAAPLTVRSEVVRYAYLQHGEPNPETPGFDRPDWWDHAACAHTDHNRDELDTIFFPYACTAKNTAAARAICADCPVAAECLEVALAAPQDLFGVFAGTTPVERRRIRKQRRAVAS